MIIKIDRIEDWNIVHSDNSFGDMRRYYLAKAPYRALLVCRNGLSLSDVRGMLVDAQVGNDSGYPGLSRSPGETQTKITIYRVARGLGGKRLSQILQAAPTD